MSSFFHVLRGAWERGYILYSGIDSQHSFCIPGADIVSTVFVSHNTHSNNIATGSGNYMLLSAIWE